MLAYLEYKYNQHENSFLNQYGHYTDEQLVDFEESIGHDDTKPYKDFDSQMNFFSKRRQLDDAENNWLSTTDSEYPFSKENPDYSYIQDDEFRTILNQWGEVRVASKYYRFLADGSYVEALPTAYSAFVAMRDENADKAVLAEGIIFHPSNDSDVSIMSSCRGWRRDRDKKVNGNWRFDYVTSIWSNPWFSRVMAKTKSYHKKNSRWRKKRATISASIFGNTYDGNCIFWFRPSAALTKRRKKVKAYWDSGSVNPIKTNSGELHSTHYSDKVGDHLNTLTF